MEFKKSLGQNFFVNKNLASQITNIVNTQSPNILVEIGPGTGFFTSYFHDLSKLILVEKDDTLAKNLKTKFPNATIENIDFLKWNLEDLGDTKEKRILFFGSLPYNVSKRIIKKIITSNYFTNPAYFIIQKEVAEKYIAQEPNNNLLSLQTSLYAKPKKILTISPESFKPKPRVDSAFISFSPKTQFDKVNKESFENFLEECFSHPRKTLRNNLKRFSFKEEDIVNQLLGKRPQHLSIEDFLFLYNNLTNLLI